MVTLRRSIGCAALAERPRLRAGARPTLAVLACVAGLFASDQASARDYAPRNLGGWTVAASKDGKGCFMTRDYARNGGTTLLLGLNIDGTNRLSILNPNWSIRPRDQLKLNFQLSNSSYPDHFAVGMASEQKQGFVTSFGAKFPSYFAASKILNVSRGDVPVERLHLDGAEAAVAELKNCVEAQREGPTPPVARKTRSDDIPSDPFAVGPARKSRK